MASMRQKSQSHDNGIQAVGDALIMKMSRHGPTLSR